MEITPLNEKMKLFGFNNLTKYLSFNLYDICYAKTINDKKAYIEYIDEFYNSERLTNISKEVSDMIGANILNIASQDYEPQGSSVTILIAEEPVDEEQMNQQINEYRNTSLAHLNKSHIAAHTYPESHPDNGISTFRADMDVVTCGQISPLKSLNYLIESFNPDIVKIDYRVRGFTRDVEGNKYYIDHKINSIQNYISKEISSLYTLIDTNVYQENIFHTKMMLKEFDLDDYLFGISKKDLMKDERKRIKHRLKKEMLEIFYGTDVNYFEFKGYDDHDKKNKKKKKKK